MSRPVNKTLEALASNKAVCTALLSFLREREESEVQTLHSIAIAALSQPEMQGQAQRQHGRVLFLRDMIFELDKAKP